VCHTILTLTCIELLTWTHIGPKACGGGEGMGISHIKSATTPVHILPFLFKITCIFFRKKYNGRNKIPSFYSLNYTTTIGSLLHMGYMLEVMGNRKMLANIHIRERSQNLDLSLDSSWISRMLKM
jgi:hypothetical protein